MLKKHRVHVIRIYYIIFPFDGLRETASVCMRYALYRIIVKQKLSLLIFRSVRTTTGYHGKPIDFTNKTSAPKPSLNLRVRMREAKILLYNLPLNRNIKMKTDNNNNLLFSVPIVEISSNVTYCLQNDCKPNSYIKKSSCRRNVRMIRYGTRGTHCE